MSTISASSTSSLSSARGVADGGALARVSDAHSIAKTSDNGLRVGGMAIQGKPNLLKEISEYGPDKRFVLQGRLMTGHTTQGQRVFWLEGQQGARYLLRQPSGGLVTEMGAAETRAKQLISAGGATKLRSIHIEPALKTELRPAPGKESTLLSINLEDPSINASGGQGRQVIGFAGRGEPGSALTSTMATDRARSLGYEVTVLNANPNLTERNARLSAWIRVPNTAQGGRDYADMTRADASGGPRFSAPKNANDAFMKAFSDRRVEQAWGDVGTAGVNVVTARASAGAARGSAGRTVTVTPPAGGQVTRVVGPRPTVRANNAVPFTPRSSMPTLDMAGTQNIKLSQGIAVDNAAVGMMTSRSGAHRSISGTTINALSQQPVSALGVSKIANDLRSLDPPGRPGLISGPAIAKVQEAFRGDGQALGQSGINAIRAALARWNLQ
jgi:hypothetical protein